MLLSSRLKKLRKENNLTQGELAKILGFSRTTIANYEKGTRMPTPKTIMELANLFEVDIDYLFGNTNYIKNFKKCFQTSKRILLTINVDNCKVETCSQGAILFYGLNRKKLQQKTLSDLGNISKYKLIFYFKNSINFELVDKHCTYNSSDNINVKIVYLKRISKKLVLILILPEHSDKKCLTIDTLNNNITEFNIHNKKELISLIREEYINIIIEGKKEEAFSLIIKGLSEGLDLKDIYLKILEPVLKKVGYMWQMQQISVSQEHIISNATDDILSKLQLFFPNTAKKKYKALALTAPGELHEIGLKIVCNFLDFEGWSTYYLGRLTSVNDVLNSLQQFDINLLLISATMKYHISQVENVIDSVHKSSVNNKKLKIIVGGNAFNKENFSEIGADGYAKNAKNAVKIANRLVSDS